MKRLILAPIILLVASCANKAKIDSPVKLSEAILTLPSEAIAGMSKEGRQDYLNNTPGDYSEENRRIHYYADSSDAGGDPESMFFLRLFEDSNGKTIAASHSARPFANGSEPTATNTFIYRLDSGSWTDITDSALPSAVTRKGWFRFNVEGPSIPYGDYEQLPRQDGRGRAYDFAESKGSIIWKYDHFKYKTNKVAYEAH
jgi:hypothetical protein